MTDCKYLVRGKVLKEWAKTLNISLARAYQLYYRGELDARIDGTWKAKDSGAPAKLFFGKSRGQWAKELGRCKDNIRVMVKDGRLERIANGEDPEVVLVYCAGKPQKPFNGVSRREIQDKLGVSRQRVHQLIKAGNMDAKLRGENLLKLAADRVRQKTDAFYMRFYDKSLTIGEMCDKGDVSFSCMISWLKSRRLPYKRGKRGPKGKNNGSH